MARIVTRLLPFVLLLSAAPSWALTNYTPQDLSQMTTQYVDSLIQTVAIGTSFRAYMPASNMGVAGFDLGIDVTAISAPDDFKQAISLATNGSATVPALIPVPGIKLQKGLPFGLDVGFTYLTYQSTIKVVGGDIQYNFLKLAGSSFAARVAANYGKLYFLETRSYNVDLIASHGFFIIEPYVGAGMQTWNGQLSYSGSIQGLPANVSANSSGTNPHVFVGVPLRILFLKLTAEYDHSFAGFNLYGAHFSISL